MTGTLHALTRYVVKGLSGEAMASLPVRPGQGVKLDRSYALALPDTPFDPAHPVPQPKTKFAMLARHAALARYRSRFEEAGEMLHLNGPGLPAIAASLATPDGRAAVEDALGALIPEELQGRRLRVVAAPGHRFTDVSVVSAAMMEAISLINLASVRALAAAIGRPVDPRRFRGNLLVDGLPPWAEFDRLDQEIAIGGVAFRVVRRTKRCPATEVDPETAVRDMRVPAELVAHFGHADMGVYLVALGDGVLRPGAAVVL
ncbi:MAG: MOSC domain-containing protein [Rhodospirillales bacterium]|nr:MOSC domain-containing protein [Rhodospirillales bacterium]